MAASAAVVVTQPHRFSDTQFYTAIAASPRQDMGLTDFPPGEFLDDHEEQHAAGTGIGVGAIIAFSGDLKLAGVVAVVLVRAIRMKRPKPDDTQNLLNDIRREPHYFAGGLAVGIALGTLSRLL